MIKIVEEDTLVTKLKNKSLYRGTFGGYPVRDGVVSATVTTKELNMDDNQTPEKLAKTILKVSEAGWTHIELYNDHEDGDAWFKVSRAATEKEKIAWECFMEEYKARQEAKDHKLYEKLKKQFESDEGK